MIKLKFVITSQSKKQLEMFRKDIVMGIQEDLPPKLAERGAIIAQRNLQRNVPIGVFGDLYNSITKSVFRKRQGKLLAMSRAYISPAQEEVALDNEYGPTEVITYRLADPKNKKLYMWVLNSPRLRGDIREKMIKKGFITVGNPATTWLGTYNKFMEESFNDTLNEMDSEIAVQIAKLIDKRGRNPTSVTKGYR